MSTVGALSFNICRGLPQVLKARVDEWVVAGLDGVGAQTLGQGDAAFELATVKYCLPAAGPIAAAVVAQTLLDLCYALQGTVTTVVDDWGDSYSNIVVLHVEGSKTPCYYQGQAAVRVEVRWRMVTT